ncbi:hypothetical protein [Embleya sp. MST-111070]|uniref:hypothetical protein n=1 Tax=Embleya sp. MST-111070 TaxID=3398231 RepID=UPI003F74177D
MSQVPAWLLRHRVTVEPYRGESAYGKVFGPPIVDVPAMVDETVRVVRAPDGRQVTSSAQIIAAPGLDCPAESRVTLPDGRITTAITGAQHTAPGLPVPASSEVNVE